MYKTADYDLRKLKMPSVSNRNLIALKWQKIHVISNIKYAAISSETWPGSLLDIQQRQGGYLRGDNYFTKNSISDVSKGSEYVIRPVNHKNNQTR